MNDDVDFGTPEEVLAGLDRINKHNAALAERASQPSFVQKVAGPEPQGTTSCTNCSKPFTDALRFCARCWNDLAITDTINKAKLRESAAHPTPAPASPEPCEPFAEDDYMQALEKKCFADGVNAAANLYEDISDWNREDIAKEIRALAAQTGASGTEDGR